MKRMKYVIQVSFVMGLLFLGVGTFVKLVFNSDVINVLYLLMVFPFVAGNLLQITFAHNLARILCRGGVCEENLAEASEEEWSIIGNYLVIKFILTIIGLVSLPVGSDWFFGIIVAFLLGVFFSENVIVMALRKEEKNV